VADTLTYLHVEQNIAFAVNIKALFGEKIKMKWNQDLNPEGLGMKLES